MICTINISLLFQLHVNISVVSKPFQLIEQKNNKTRKQIYRNFVLVFFKMWHYVVLLLIIILYHPSTNKSVSNIDYPEDRFDFMIGKKR